MIEFKHGFFGKLVFGKHDLFVRLSGYFVFFARFLSRPRRRMPVGEANRLLRIRGENVFLNLVGRAMKPSGK